jgi:hypothetical protein
MAQPAFLSDGSTPRRTDAKWVRWTKILGKYQDAVGALPANNPARGDGIRVVKQKVLCSLAGVSYTG